jgi:poly(glycerol-phosphate) alpha-glucosyltransferase
VDEEARTARPLAGKRIGLLTAFASRRNGGVFEAVAQQAATIAALGGEPQVFALADPDAAADRHRFGGAPVHLARVVGPAQIGYAPELTGILVRAGLDLLHLHGIWMYPSAAGAQWARRTERPYIVSPHGMLDPWITARGRGKKALARIGYERASWRAAARLHALTPREASDIARESGRSDAVVIPNAGPEAQPLGAERRKSGFLYLGRIHPKKNVSALIAAWRALDAADELGGATLTIAGWGAAEDVAALEADLEGAPPSARFVGPLFGADKAAAFAEAGFFVLPSHSEGLPVVVLEAWAANLPVLMTQECNLPEGFAAGAAIDCGYEPAEIAAALRRALAMPGGERRAMAQAAHALATGPFSAGAVTARWGEVYSAEIARVTGRSAA